MHAVSTNQLVDILYFSNKLYIYIYKHIYIYTYTLAYINLHHIVISYHQPAQALVLKESNPIHDFIDTTGIIEY